MPTLHSLMPVHRPARATRGIRWSLALAIAALTWQWPSSVKAAASPNAHDFDFLLGQWVVHNHRLKQWLAHSEEWIDFDADDSFHRLPGNLGLEENYRTKYWPGFVGIGLQLYATKAQQWNLYWADSRNAPGEVRKLAGGAFDGALGTFYARDTFQGKPIRVRIVWKKVDDNHAYWEQAFSDDEGKSWEMNWAMDFVRRP